MQYVALIDRRARQRLRGFEPGLPRVVIAGIGDGRKRAKERGVRFGRPRKLTPRQPKLLDDMTNQATQ